MGHHHHHDHSHSHGDLKGRNLFISILLNILITLAQVVGGLISGSLALLSDALHNFSDVLSLIISYVAQKLGKKQANKHKTFGYKRAEIMAAFVNAATLVVVAIFLMKEAVERLFDPQEIASDLVIWLSILGILANGFSVLLLKKDSKDNMNMRSAYLHLLTDMMASVAVLIGGILMSLFQLYWVDAVLTMIIGIYLIYMGYDLLKESTKVLMLFTPKSIVIQDIVESICTIEPVKNVHHVHIWQLNEDEVHMEAHIDFKEDIKLSEFDAILGEIEEHVYHKHGINHVNIQPEFDKCDSKSIIVQD
ncbi:cation transporter [Flagellimonas taeanensis]|jgi:cobalt-zinc-cadmium efflux system protein|uniref:Cobalt-zinc-cadmium efflux system protein n=1 Tax=Flagellimonas taeanensis TaxID=1005926 RepID=A0A1M6Q8P6_9FLAO|nr:MULTISPECIES: cation diffusion facilitator family transporter [Allomuricauda]MDC6385422.1 cation diffusion facilitator family transporter [Muricauda sp. SK9]MEE1961568.1 cation diffusion facilitator family transporter [Allomuricauda taeanensis]RIV53064.1 cation transporter [Allomuricauda taeanensis]SFB69591.1 cobalt-zinc-cadmium efflux system protein [Allomuricauda taeanensis]SHK16649.1 cobalt-zinc-cadmium efflux system protein [Allomuricauda taeanensis]